MFRTGSALGIRPSELSPLDEVPTGFRRPMNPHAVSPVGNPAAWAVGRPNGPRLLGFYPRESPWRRAARLTRPTLDAPLGFDPLRVCGSAAWPEISLQLLPRAWPTRQCCRAGRTTEYRSATAGPSRRTLTGTTDQATLAGFRHQPAPETFERAARPGYSFSPRAASHITADRPTLLGRTKPRSTGAARSV